ncbi:MAG: penicillin-binding protein 2 [Patescibacteria group bacterium]
MRVNEVNLVERRARILAALVCVFFALLVGRLWVLQIVRGAANYRLSQSYTTYDIPVPAPRGVLYDRHGRLLVTNRKRYDVVGLLATLREHPEVVERLALIAGCPAQEINARLTSPKGVLPYQLYPVIKNVPVKTAIRIQESLLNLPGVEILEVPCRQYIYGDFATHVFGFLREISEDELAALSGEGYLLGESIGKTGLEKTLEPYLRGINGFRRIEIDRAQRPVAERARRDPEPGGDAWLTLDYAVQEAAEKALRERLKYLQRYTRYRKARAGAVIALDPQTGEILALASQPSFNPNLFADVVPAAEFGALNANPDKPFNNRVLCGRYPPASTFKPFTVYAALREGKTRPGEKFICNGFDRVYKGQARCWLAGSGRGHGRLDLVGGLKNSCNVVMYELGRRLGVERLARFARLFRFGAKTGLDLAPGEAQGIVPDPAYKKRVRPNDPWRELETLHFAIGQGYLEVTPLQLAVAYAGLATGGRFFRPHLVREIRDLSGRVIRSFTEHRPYAVLKMDGQTRALILEGLNEVVSGGTAAAAFAGFPLDRYPVAGKTGTGQKRNYDDFSLFACFAPADKPRIVVVVVIEQGGSGSQGAAPVARKVLEAFFGVTPAQTAPVPAPPAAASEPGDAGANEAPQPTAPAPAAEEPLDPSPAGGSETPDGQVQTPGD